jgi:hypothetical protein
MANLRASQPQQAIAQAAALQHGIVTTAQLRAGGLIPSVITQWSKAGRLHRIHRGVYAVGHAAPSHEARWMAAVLALGRGAVLSHRSAAMLWRMLEPAASLVHVTVIGNNGRKRRRGLVVHRSSTLTANATTRRAGIPVTKPERTLSDLRRMPDQTEYRRALRQAEFRQLPTGELPEADGTRSGLESSFIAFCGRHHLPRPEINVKVGPYTADFLWREQRVIVETDAFRTHGGEISFEEDRQRDMWLTAHGYRVVRVTDRQLADDPKRAAASLRAILGA